MGKNWAVIFVVLFNCTLVYSQNHKVHTEIKNFFSFYYVESKYEPGLYVNKPISHFSPYKNTKFPVQFPDSNRMITLQAMFLLDSNHLSTDLAVVIPPIMYACNIYINGVNIGKRGSYSPLYVSRLHNTEYFLLPEGLLHFNNRQVNILNIELLPKCGENSAVTDIFITSRKNAGTYTFRRNLLSINFTRGMSVASLLIAMYFLIFYFYRRRNRIRYYLFFAALAFCYPFTFINNTLFFDFTNQFLLEKITRISFNLITFFYFATWAEYTNILKYRKKMLVLLFGMVIMLIAGTILQQDITSLLNYSVKYSAIFNMVFDIYITVISLKYLLKNRNIKGVVLASISIFLIFSIAYDSFYFIVLQQKAYMPLIPYGMFILLAGFFYVLAYEQSEFYILADNKTQELKQINENLEKLVIERTQKILNSEVQFQTIFNKSSNSAFLIKGNGEVIMVNTAFTKLTGYTLSDFANNTIAIIINRNDIEFFKDAFYQLYTDKVKEVTRNLQIISKFGTLHWILLNMANSYNAENRFEYILGTFIDITEIKTKEIALKNSELVLKEAQQIAQIGNWTYNFEQQKLFWSDEIYKMLGYQPGEIEISYPVFLSFVHPDDKEAVDMVFRKSIETKSTYEIEHRMLTKNNAVKYFLERCNTIYNEHGKPLIARGIVMDITQQSKLRKKTELNSSRLFDLLELSQKPITSLNQFYEYSVNSAVKITDSQYGFIYQFNQSENKFVLSSFSGNITSESDNNLFNLSTIVEKQGIVSKIIETREPLIITDFSEIQTSSLKIFRLLAIPLIVNDKIVALAGVANKTDDYDKDDILQLNLLLDTVWSIYIQKQNEDKIRELAQALQVSNLTKDKFFSIIAHDLRSPFNGLVGFTDLLISNLEDYSKSEILENLLFMKYTADNLLKLVENLLEWARNQSGTINFNPELLDILSLISEVLELNKQYSNRKNINIMFQSDIHFFNADKNMVQTILRNLISNAIKYTKIGGEIKIEVKNENQGMLIMVTDNGVGMSEAVLQSLFTVTKKISTLGTVNELGTGLGLVLCYEFVQKHNGKIWADSKMGIGSTFYVWFPVSDV